MTEPRAGFLSACAVLALSFAFVVPLSAEKPPEKKRDPKEQVLESRSEAKNEGKTQQKKEEAEKQLSEIDKIWMREIQGRETSENSGTEGSSTTEKSGSADDVQLRNPGVIPSTNEEGPSFLSTAFRFVALLAVMLGGLFLVVRFIRMRNPALLPSGDLATVMATIPLVQGKFLQIVDLAGRLVVLGVSDHGVNMIMSVDDAVTADRIRLWHRDRGRVVPASWAELLTKSIKKADFKFWEQKPSEQAAPDFKEMLEKLGARTEPAFTEAPVSGVDAPPEERPPVEDAPRPRARPPRAQAGEAALPPRPTAGLEALLARQKKKLDQIKSQATQNEIGFPDRS